MKSSLFKAIAGSTSFKLLSAITSFITVPLLLKALGTNQYAIWVTSTALVSWLNLFDFGSGYSLKNKVTEAIALDDFRKINILIAGTIQFYFLMSGIALCLFIGALFLLPVFKDNVVLAVMIYLPIIFSFPFTLSHFIIQGRKKFNSFNLILTGQSILWLIVVLLYRYNLITPNIYFLGLFYGLLFLFTNLVILVVSLNGMNFKWKTVMEIKHFVDAKDSLKVGYRFFLLQISSLFLFSLGNVLTYNHLNLKNVAEFDTVNKIYLMGMTLFNVVISVFWAEISHAKALKDTKKLWKLFKQLILIALGFSLGTAIFSFLIPMLVSAWTKKIILVEVSQLIPFALLISIQAIAYAGAVVLNAFEDLQGQIVLSVLASCLIVPLSNYFFKIDFGIGTVPLASSILLIPSVIFVLVKSNILISKLETND